MLGSVEWLLQTHDGEVAISKITRPVTNAAAADPLIKKPDKLNISSNTLGKSLLLVSI